MNKHKIIVNPTAGKDLAGESIAELEKTLISLHIDYDLVQTEHPWHAAELAQEAIKEGFNSIVSVGGDGTFNEVLNGIMLAKNAGSGSVRLGAIPIGRGNDFSFSMGIPTEIQEACQVLAEGKTKMIDIGKISGELYPEGRYFGNGVGIGFDAMVGFVAAELKLSGFLAYLVSAFKTMRIYSPAPTMKLEFNDETREEPFLMVSIMNGRRMGGGFMMAPDSISDDGKFDVCMVKEVGKLKTLQLITQFIKGTQNEDENVNTIRTSKIVATATKGSLPVHADGETICTEGEQVSVEILPKVVELITVTTEGK